MDSWCKSQDNNVMHAKSGLRVVLKWKIYRPDSVIIAVIPLESMKFSLKQLLAVITLVGVALALTPWVHRTYCLLQIKSHAWGSG